MKIKDLKNNANLEGLKVKTSNGIVGYWKNVWQKGVWITETKEDNSIVNFVPLEGFPEWEVLNEN